MQTMPKEWLHFLRGQFPLGSQVRTWKLDEPQNISFGTLEQIDEEGRFHTRMEDGSIRKLALGEEQFSIHPPESTLLKLYMPLTADFYPRDEWGNTAETSEAWDGQTLLDYEVQVLGALVKNRMPEEAERGLMHWYGKQDSLDAKVRSAVFSAEVKNGQLWGVAECQVVGKLTPTELGQLKDYISGQASDGWGESFEQKEVEVDGGELYVHLWSLDGWSIQTEQERFAPKVAKGLPELCFSTLRTTGQLICIKRGESGYYPSDWDTGDKERNVELADELNENLGVTPAQRQAMEIGSMAGWDVPGADPGSYGRHKVEQPEEGMTFGYGATKGAVDMMTRMLAKELGPEVCVNAIGPTMTYTPMMVGVMPADPKERAAKAANMPLQRIGEPEDCAGPAVFLASAASDFMSGQIIYPDGGLTAMG